MGVIYRRSIEIDIDSFTTVLANIISTIDMNNKVYLMGDFNVDILKHTSLGPCGNFFAT